MSNYDAKAEEIILDAKRGAEHYINNPLCMENYHCMNFVEEVMNLVGDESHYKIFALLAVGDGSGAVSLWEKSLTPEWRLEREVQRDSALLEAAHIDFNGGRS